MKTFAVKGPATPKLHDVRKDVNSLYCGPTVVASLCNRKGSVVVDAFRQIRGDKRRSDGARKPIRGTYPREVHKALQMLSGYKLLDVTSVEKPGQTLAQWAKGRSPEQRRRAYVLIVANHFIAVKGSKLVDTYTKGKVVALKDAPHRRKRIREIYLVTGR